MNQLMTEEDQDSDKIVHELLFEYDKTFMPVPDIEYEPHLLISKVRKHYMEYIIKLLSINYENNQRPQNKNIHLPSAIWRCAKNIEITAAQTCMVVQLYRKNIITVIKELKQDTKKGKLYKKLCEYVYQPPQNEKKVQTPLSKSSDCTCQCICNQRKKRRRESDPSKQSGVDFVTSTTSNISIENYKEQSDKFTVPSLNTGIEDSDLTQKKNYIDPPRSMSIESRDSDELMQQLEKLFQEDYNDDDLFEGSLCNIPSSSMYEVNTNKLPGVGNHNLNIEIESRSSNTKASEQQSFDERLSSIAGQLVNNFQSNSITKPVHQKIKRNGSSKWLCEEYFLKLRLYEMLDQLRDCNRAKLARIKEILVDLFGDDSDDEGVMSPLEETQEFITSCKERIAPWVVRTLTPFYIKGGIKGKALFKAVAKHLIRLIYQCSKYPSEYEVKSFVSDFLESHKKIRCEADFKQFRIENI
ncbi:unnamed protein product [Parnassius apollo]|uniref:(apollo) hypothetical protein n=1 Tax=Parnassius apollo TaxID=110799 RepID=A0A8S3X360_PARAO|nr:unnamed protein product [Parnassius apollo]